jgi:hypothetical protein
MSGNSKTLAKGHVPAKSCTHSTNVWQFVASVDIKYNDMRCVFIGFLCRIWISCTFDCPNQSSTQYSLFTNGMKKQPRSKINGGKSKDLLIEIEMLAVWVQFIVHIYELKIRISTKSMEQSHSGESNRCADIIKFPRSL